MVKSEVGRAKALMLQKSVYNFKDGLKIEPRKIYFLRQLKVPLEPMSGNEVETFKIP